MVCRILQLREPHPVCPLMKVFQDFLVSLVVKTLSSSAMAVGSIPGQEAKIPHAFQSNVQTSNRSNIVRNSFVVVQPLCHIQLFVTPWPAAPCLPVPHNLPEFAQVGVH